MKKTFGKIGLASLTIAFINIGFYETAGIGYFTNPIAEFLAGPALLTTIAISFWALLDMSFKD